MAVRQERAHYAYRLARGIAAAGVSVVVASALAVAPASAQLGGSGSSSSGGGPGPIDPGPIDPGPGEPEGPYVGGVEVVDGPAADPGVLSGRV